MANLDRFLLFSAVSEKLLFANSWSSRKLRKAIKRRKAKGGHELSNRHASTSAACTVEQRHRQFKAGLKMLNKREANLPAPSQPKTLC